VSENLLLKALPTLCAHLTNPDKDVRGPVIAFVGELFAAENSNLPTMFSTTFRQWLERFHDSDVSIRKNMVETSMGILFNQTDPITIEAVAKVFKSKLCDPDKEVRRRAVQCTCELAANGCDNVTNSLLRAVGDRCTDRIAAIRMDAITGLAQVFRHMISQQWSQLDDEYDETGAVPQIRVSQSLHTRLGWIPGHVIKTFNISDVELRSRVLQLIDEILLPKSLTAGVRAAGLVHIFGHLDDEAKGVLGRIFAIRHRIQTVVQEFAQDPKNEDVRCRGIGMPSCSTVDFCCCVIVGDCSIAPVRFELQECGV